ncbi:MAG TPA: DUF5681 domain-containing protein [Candidatus Dormibacteraeota bacterium]|jgi:hypothetical protein|nr:DUF5681 domain-containing protein [Candidatus Dormibacteraeota bacterium]
MDQRKHEEKDPVGYKKPPRHTQFKPGQSGNPKGRPKKAATLPDVLSKELRTRVPIVNNGKRKKVSLLVAIMKQHLNKAANGDSKAAAMVLNLIKENKLEVGDNLSELVQEFRAVHNRHAAADRDRSEIGEGQDKNEEQV